MLKPYKLDFCLISEIFQLIGKFWILLLFHALDILFLNKKSNILLAIGAAILDPGPECSATTAIAYFGSSTGPNPAKRE
jgi:hypothetical protein